MKGTDKKWWDFTSTFDIVNQQKIMLLGSITQSMFPCFESHFMPKDVQKLTLVIQTKGKLKHNNYLRYVLNGCRYRQVISM